MHNQNVGKLGEKRTEEHYLRQGYSLVNKNYRTPFGEFDLIVSKYSITVFVEVKCRSSLSFGRPEEAINKDKLRKIRKGIEYYLIQMKEKVKDYRFDVVSIILASDGEVAHFEVFENVGV
ncbi:YraN family protein [Candidatus Gottesmanbacteria bacterium]|nr:YraN family protein [Candidatus Gottesmanbacteria bacterium]